MFCIDGSITSSSRPSSQPRNSSNCSGRHCNVENTVRTRADTLEECSMHSPQTYERDTTMGIRQAGESRRVPAGCPGQLPDCRTRLQSRTAAWRSMPRTWLPGRHFPERLCNPFISVSHAAEICGLSCSKWSDLTRCRTRVLIECWRLQDNAVVFRVYPLPHRRANRSHKQHRRTGDFACSG